MRGALATLALGLAGAAGAAQPPPCRVSVSIEPELAWVDQQVLYRLRVESRDDLRDVEWLVPPTLPGLRWERLPGLPDAGRVTRDGVGYRVREEHRAIFPERAGEIRLAEASLRCTAAWEVRDVLVPTVSLHVRELPAGGRPPHFAGLVGALRVAQQVHPGAAAVGESLRLSVRMRGSGNLWDAGDPLAGRQALGSAELIRLEPEQDLQRGEALGVGRLFRYDLVPREPGALHVPELRVPYFDPATGEYAVAVAAPLVVDVAPRQPAASSGASPEAPEGPGPPQPPSAAGRLWSAALAALVAAAGLCAWLWRRRGPRTPQPGAALAAAARASAGGDQAAAGAALARALRAALARHLSGVRHRTPEELLAEPDLPTPLRDAARLLAAVERARFDPEAPPPDARQVERAVAALHGMRP